MLKTKSFFVLDFPFLGLWLSTGNVFNCCAAAVLGVLDQRENKFSGCLPMKNWEKFKSSICENLYYQLRTIFCTSFHFITFIFRPFFSLYFVVMTISIKVSNVLCNLVGSFFKKEIGKRKHDHFSSLLFIFFLSCFNNLIVLFFLNINFFNDNLKKKFEFQIWIPILFWKSQNSGIKVFHNFCETISL